VFVGLDPTNPDFLIYTSVSSEIASFRENPEIAKFAIKDEPENKNHTNAKSHEEAGNQDVYLTRIPPVPVNAS
jgi:hypothetical protein